MLNKLVPDIAADDQQMLNETLARRRVYEEVLASLPPPRRIITKLSNGKPLPAGIVLANWGFAEQMGCRVVAVRKNNGAARSGIRSRDVLLGINGAAIGDRGHAWAVETIERRSRMGDLRLHLLRDRPPQPSSETSSTDNPDSEDDQEANSARGTLVESTPSVATRVARMCRSIVPVRHMQRGQTRPTRVVPEVERTHAPAIERMQPPSTRASESVSSYSWASGSSSTGPSNSRSSEAYSSFLAEEPATPCIFGSLILWLCCGVGEMETETVEQQDLQLAGASVTF